MKIILPSISNNVTTVVLVLQTLFSITHAYMTLSDDFLRNISTSGPDFEPESGALLSPLLVPRIPGSSGHAAVQQHFVDFFRTQIPKWNLDWYNSTATKKDGTAVPISNLVFSREPPWTKVGQTNWLIIAAHYDSKSMPEGQIDATSAVPCAIMMQVARSIDGYMTQMHDEMDALGEGGTIAMDMGIKLVFLDGKESLDGGAPALYGSRDMSHKLERRVNPVGSGYPNALSQIRNFVLLDNLGSAHPMVPSYCLVTSWVYEKIANLEARMREIGLLEATEVTSFLFERNSTIVQSGTTADHVPFMEAGTPFMNIQPSSLASSQNVFSDSPSLDLPTVRDWVKIVTGFTLEWLDMMEVWPE
ncbi:related to glutaminyl-peptide cyclotransferase [Rhynchosporium graminicola]|uniref:Peptide hydrolase n=1 Tax=Rhynchosporium graminicola TaxID=2792576 RepID=A0A1E1LT52_9HELO|nr:related to glutaminyl-peptide cyclotransferase [Rhynchosporium commune]